MITFLTFREWEREREDLIWNKLATCLLLKVQVRWSLKNGLTINCWLLSLFYLNLSYFVTGILLPRYFQGPINALIFRGLFKLLRKNRGVYSVQWKKIPLEAMFVPPKQNSILTADRERERERRDRFLTCLSCCNILGRWSFLYPLRFSSSLITELLLSQNILNVSLISVAIDQSK